MNDSVAAVVVTFQPEIAQLSNLVHALARQCHHVYIIDNSTPSCRLTAALTTELSNIDVLSLGYNSGVAAAQNLGLHLALNSKCEAVLLFDQDSVINEGFVSNICDVYLRAKNSNLTPIAAIGPCYSDFEKQVESPFVRVSGLKVLRVPCSQEALYVEVDCLIASGSLLICSALRTIGLMREDLFIDYVDTEWCLRAKQMGYRCIGACRVEMQHSIGDEHALLFGRRFTLHSPSRHYYLMRNAIALYFHSDLPLQWKVADGMRLICKFFIYSVLGKPRVTHIKMMLHGLWHGVIGRMGKQ
jgi:rhamnosyltransferase